MVFDIHIKKIVDAINPQESPLNRRRSLQVEVVKRTIKDIFKKKEIDPFFALSKLKWLAKIARQRAKKERLDHLQSGDGKDPNKNNLNTTDGGNLRETRFNFQPFNLKPTFLQVTTQKPFSTLVDLKGPIGRQHEYTRSIGSNYRSYWISIIDDLLAPKLRVNSPEERNNLFENKNRLKKQDGQAAGVHKNDNFVAPFKDNGVGIGYYKCYKELKYSNVLLRDPSVQK